MGHGGVVEPVAAVSKLSKSDATRPDAKTQRKLNTNRPPGINRTARETICTRTLAGLTNQLPRPSGERKKLRRLLQSLSCPH